MRPAPALVFALAVGAGCGRFDFDGMGIGDGGGSSGIGDGRRTGDGGGGGGDGSGDGGGGGLACVTTTPNGWLGSVVPNEPGSGLPHLASLTVSADMTYTMDNVTGLAWEYAPDSTTYSLAGAEAHCASLTIGGCTQWRVPQQPELATIVDHTQAPVINATGFAATPTDTGWWSATFEQGTVNNAWSVRFSNGNQSAGAVAGPNHVRCVLSAVTPDAPPARYTMPASGIAADVDTGLQWQTGDNGAAVPYATAVSFCSGLGGAWRVPSIAELQSLFDYATSPALYPGVFGSPAPQVYWTSTTYVGNQMIIDDTEGIVTNAPTTDSHFVRCVQ